MDRCVCASMNPGSSVASPRSITWAFGGISALAPTPRILSPSTTITPGETTRSPIPSNIRAALSTIAPFCAHASPADSNAIKIRITAYSTRRGASARIRSMQFTCNICGADCTLPAQAPGREVENCSNCGSTVRLRALIALLSQEIFGLQLTIPEFPILKGIRGIGMSDLPDVASRLAEKFDYTNTFYHQSPMFDVTHPDERDWGRFDFILSSEVMEHVPAPVETAFSTLHRMLKPDGLLLMTTPYNLAGGTIEHFPELHEYTLASPGGRTVLVNRRRDGSMEVLENLEFHGGHGSTLEMRKFTEASLRAVLAEAGFSSVDFATQSLPEFGVEHAETWSLPIAARKGNFQPPAAELAREYREACRRA